MFEIKQNTVKQNDIMGPSSHIFSHCNQPSVRLLHIPHIYWIVPYFKAL